jgi:hypothetical protein
MAIRTLKRKVIIREYDFEKVKQQAFMPIGLGSLYDRVQFIPLNQEGLEKSKVLEILQGKKDTPLIKADWNDNVPAMLLYHLRDYLYDKRYYDWKVSLDEQGYVCVQARNNTPKTRVGYGIFEKDFTSRI